MEAGGSGRGKMEWQYCEKGIVRRLWSGLLYERRKKERKKISVSLQAINSLLTPLLSALLHSQEALTLGSYPDSAETFHSCLSR